MMESITAQIQLYIDKGNYVKAEELIEENSNGNEEHDSRLWVYKIRLLRHQGNLEKALNLVDKIHKLNTKIQSFSLEIQVLVEEAYIYWNMSNFDKAFTLVERGELIANRPGVNTEDIELEISTLDNLKGLIYLNKGDLIEARKFFTSGYDRRKKINAHHMVGISLNNIGVCYYRQGLLEESKRYLNDSIKIFNQLNDPIDIGLPYSNLALIYYDLDDFEKSLEYFKKSEKIETIMGNAINIAETYFGMVQIHLKMKNTEIVAEYLNKLSKLSNDHPYPIISQWYRLGEALVSMEKPRIYSKIKALELLSGIVSEPVLLQRLTITAMKELCNFYIMELQLYDSSEALDDAIKLTNELYDTAQDQSSFSLIVEVLLLNSKLSLIRGDYVTALLLLDQALLTSVENGLVGLEIKITLEQVAINAEAEKWKRLSQEDASFREKIEESRIIEYLKDIKKVVENNN